MEFPTLLEEFFSVAGTIYKERGPEDPLAKQLAKFEYVATKTKEENVVEYFRDIYTTHRSAVMLGPLCDYWLREKNVVVNLTQDLKPSTKRTQHGGSDVRKNTKDIKLNLSVLYKIALTQRDKEQEVVKLLLEWDKLRAPLYVMNVLYRIFKYLDPEEKKLDIYLDQLETVMTDEVVHRDTIGSFVSGLAAKLGFKTSDAPIKESDIAEAFASITENPNMSNILNIVAQARETGGPPDVGSLISSIKSLPMVKDLPPEMMNEVFGKLKDVVPGPVGVALD